MPSSLFLVVGLSSPVGSNAASARSLRFSSPAPRASYHVCSRSSRFTCFSGVRAAEHRRTLMFLVRGVACAEEELLVDVVWQFEEDVAAHLAQLDDIVARPRLDRFEVEPQSAGAARACPDMGLERINSRSGRRSASLGFESPRAGYLGEAWRGPSTGAGRWTTAQMRSACARAWHKRGLSCQEISG